MALIEQYADHIVIHTGQNYDYELNEVFFKDLKIRKYDYFLNVDISSLGKVLGKTLCITEEVLKIEKPDDILILRDTNINITCIIAKRMIIPISQMEAQNRCIDMNIHGEINFKIIDHITDLYYF